MKPNFEMSYSNSMNHTNSIFFDILLIDYSRHANLELFFIFFWYYVAHVRMTSQLFHIQNQLWRKQYNHIFALYISPHV